MQATAASAQASRLATDLGLLWRAINSGSSGDFFRAVDELELSFTQVKALHALEAQGEDELSVKELAGRLGLSVAATSRATDGLHGRGLVARREDEHDRRMKRVRLTEAGADVVTRLGEARLAGLERFVATLGPDEAAALAAALRPIVARDPRTSARKDLPR